MSVAVAPLAGAWIEIIRIGISPVIRLVAPLAGAWIEIGKTTAMRNLDPSLPSRERGLKCFLMLISSAKHQSLPSRERGLK